MNNLRQIFDTVNIGLVILDRNLTVVAWNRWMTQHSGIKDVNIVGRPLFDFFPTLNEPVFKRNCKSVFGFGNFSFFSQKLHGHLFPFQPPRALDSGFQYMQQSCTIGPIRDDSGAIDSVFLVIQDVTELAAYEKKLLETNMMDGLTGIYNRRYLDKRLLDEFQRSRRYCRELSIIVFDIDFFKKVNDTYGHQCGDYILQNVSAKIASSIRNNDCLARYGGEEFCAILPETAPQSAMILAERFREAIESLENVYNEATTVKVTISLGVSGLDGQVSSATELFSKADEALYEAKRTGRNKVVLATR